MLIQFLSGFISNYHVSTCNVKLHLLVINDAKGIAGYHISWFDHSTLADMWKALDSFGLQTASTDTSGSQTSILSPSSSGILQPLPWLPGAVFPSGGIY